MKLFTRVHWEHLLLLPTAWVVEEECEGCGRPHPVLAFGWLFWSVGIQFHIASIR